MSSGTLNPLMRDILAYKIMENQIENTDSTNGEVDEQLEELETTDLEAEDVGTLKEQLSLISDKNRQLFERTKKAEGFVKDDEGKWTKKPEPKPEAKDEPVEEDKIAESVKKILEERDIDSLDVSDELKEQVRTYAKVSNVSVKKALNSEYIQFLKEKDDKKRETEEASLGGKQRGGTKVKDYSEEFSAEDFDLTTPEGKAAFEEAKTQWRQSMGKK